MSDVSLNGPALDLPHARLPGNLNVSFGYVEGEGATMLEMHEIRRQQRQRICTSAQPEPSHVLRALGLLEDAVRGSLRFGLGRFTTAEEIEFAIARTVESIGRLRAMSSMAK